MGKNLTPTPLPGERGLESKSVPGYRTRDSPFEEPAPLRRGGVGGCSCHKFPLRRGLGGCSS